MPLVSLNTVNRWYRKDSWVYKSFTYLFKNPLWDTSVPSGFSLCPYFWLALFSLTFFRLFVYAVLGVRLLLKPFGGLLSHTDAFCVKHLGVRTGLVLAVPTLFIGCITALIVFMGMVLFYGSVHTYQEYRAADTLSALLLPIGLAIIAVPCWIYHSITRNFDNRCKVENYLRLASILAVIGALYWQYDNFIEVAMLPVLLVVEILKVIWHFVVQIPGWVWHGIVAGSVGTWHLITGVLLHTLYIIGGLLALGILGILGDRLYAKTEIATNRNQENTKAELLELQAKHVLSIFGRQSWEYDSMARHESRTVSFWKRYIWGVPEAVGLAYDIARSGREVTDADIARAKQAALDTYAVQLAAELARAKKRDEFCGKFTKYAEKAFRGVAIVAIPFRWFFRHLFKKISWVLKEVWTFLCLLFSLIKSRKQGACPYLRFEDVNKAK